MAIFYRTTFSLMLAVAVCSVLSAQDYGDAPSSYGLPSAGNSANERLGTAWSAKTTNPVTPAWTGDASDDGVVGTPSWTAGASTNSVTVSVDTDNWTQHLAMFIDLNDDGDFTDAGERFDHPSFPTSTSGNYTFSNIAIPAQNYTLNGTNKIAVRFILRFSSAITGPGDNFSYGEIEDYLFDVTPIGFSITTPAQLPDASVGNSYNETLQAVNGVGNVTWSVTGGSPPPGLSLSSGGVITGTPLATGAGQNHQFTVEAVDSDSPPSTDSVQFSIDVIGLVINESSPLSSAIEGQSYNQTFTVSNGGPTYTWTQPSGNLPGNLTLLQSGDDYILSGTPGAGTGGQNYNFTIQVSDGTMTEQKVFDLYVIGPPAQLPFTDDFSTDKGWTLGSGQGATWSIDVCGPSYVPPYGNPEPITDHSPTSDNRILGDNIGAVYPNSMTGTVWAESPAVDCSGTSDVELVFWRWLNVESPSFDHAYIEVSPDNGSTWTQVWENTSEIADSSWTEQKLNISSVAGNQSTVKVRFGIGSTDASWQYAGWCIDDLEIRELPSTTKLVLTDFEIISAYSVGSTNPAPRCYTGEQYVFDLTMDNTTANDIQVDSMTFTVTEFGQTTPENVGTWTLNVTVPFTVPANTTGHTVSGTFDCQSLSTSGAGVALENLCRIQGTEQNTNKPVETELGETFYLENGPPPPPPSMNVHENSYQGATVDSGQNAAGTDRDFGSIDIDAGPGTWVNIVIINNTNASIDVNTPTLTGADAAHFELDASQWTTNTMTLATSGANSQIFFSVRFDPYELGQKDAQVEFTHTANSPGTNPFVVPLTGNGTGNAPELQVHEIDFTGPQITHGQTATGTNRDFGTVAAGGSSQWLNVVLWNRFATDTTIDAPMPALTAGDTAEFEVNYGAMNTPHTIPGTTDFTGTTFFSIRFVPGSGATVGQKTATVSFGHNASNPGTTPFTFEVTGEVTPSGTSFNIYELSGGSPSYTINNGDPAVNGRDFGSQVVTAGPTAWLEIEIRNTGSTNLTLGNPQLMGTDANQFDIDRNTPGFTQNLAPGATTEFWLAFNPTTPGQKDASVEFTHNATTQTASPFVFDLTGLGLANAPRVEVREDNTSGPTVAYNAAAAGTSRNFGSRDVNAGASAALTIVIMNTGFLDMNVGTPTLTGADAGEFVITASAFPAVVPPNDNVTFDVAFNPGSYGNKSAMVEFSHDDPSQSTPFVFEVAGFGDAPSLEVREGTAGGPLINHGASATGNLDFGDVQLSAMPSAPLTVVLVNGGNADLTLQQPTLTGPNGGSFTLNFGGATFPATVTAGNSLSFDVSFDAAQVGLKEATVNIGHNDGGVSAPFSFDVQGVASDPNGVRITSSATLPSTKVGVSYGPEDLRATGGATPYTWALRPGESLPGGLVLSPGGQISGTVTGSTGVFTFEIRVTDANGGTSDQTFSIAIGSDNIGGGGGGSGGGGCAVQTGGGPWLWLVGVIGAAVILRRRLLCRA